MNNITETMQAILNTIGKEDQEVAQIVEQENQRQRKVIRMIPSENYASAPVCAALATAFSNKYSEGYPHMWNKEGQKLDKNGRYYQGQKFANQIENLTMQRALELFDLDANDWHVNVQPLSGAPANLAVLTGLLQPGDTIMGLNLANGGHLTHGHPANLTGKLFNAVQYELDENGYLDYENVEQMALEHKPKLIICGFTAYPRQFEFMKFREIADKVGAYLMADIAHISGLCASGVHPSPFPHADIVTTTTHKVLRGPRGGMIYCRKELGPKIDKAIIPGLQGGPHMNNICALAIALKEAKTPEYKAYAEQVVKNAKALSEGLLAEGFKLVSGGTDNHLILIDCIGSAEQVRTENGTIMAEAMEKAGIVCNKNCIPGDPKPWKPSGVRLGTPASTTLGLKEPEMQMIAKWMARIAQNTDNPEALQQIKSEIENMLTNFDPKGTLLI